MSSNDDTDSDAGEQVRVSFTLSSEVTDRSLEVSPEPIAVPAQTGRKGLAAVINHLLDRRVDVGENEGSDSDDSSDENKLPPIAFEFLIGDSNRLLRTGAEREARRQGLSLEQTIPITYLPAQEAPELSGESERSPDWISCMAFVSPSSKISSDLLCTGVYDGSIHIYHPSFLKGKDGDNEIALEELSVASSAHTAPVKCLKAVYDDEKETIFIATGSLDQTLAVHAYDTASKQFFLHSKCQDGHSASVGSLDFLDSTNLLASGDWDGMMCLWDLNNHEEDNDAPDSKKMKTNSKSSKGRKNAAVLAPTVSFQAHAQQISGMSWGNWEKNGSSGSRNNLVTASWDHSVKVWDIEKQDCLLTLNGSKVVTCLDTSFHSHGVVATGHPDCTIRLWDVRTKVSNNNSSHITSVVSDRTFRPSHKAWVSAVQWSQRNPYHLASTSHDGTVKVWDIRSSLPLHTVRAFPKEEKGLCMAYGTCAIGKDSEKENSTLFVGGTDCIVKQFATYE